MPVKTAKRTMVQVSTRTRPMRSESMPKPMPPSTAPTSVAVTSEAAWAWLSWRSAEIARSMKPRISRSNPSIA
ncbi:hypothetical protein FQZ97_1089250 [compost metagenome]